MLTYRSIYSFALTGLALFGFSANTLAASATDIALSYEAGGACYCTDAALSSPSANTIIPTPVGGQSIAQICKRIGEGPGLRIIDGLYDNAAYSDLQCGNGTSLEAANDNETTCTGLSAPGETSCKQAGAMWDLTQAFAADNTATTSQHSNSSSSSPSAIISEDPAEPSDVTLVEASYENNISNDPVTDKAENYAVYDVESTQSLTDHNARSNSPEAEVISANSIKTDLTQEQIQLLPDAITEPVPDVSELDNATAVIIIDSNGLPRTMTQEEIAKLPLADLENVSPETTILETQSTEVADATTEQSPSLGAIVGPTPSISNRRNLFGNSRLDYGYIGVGPTGFDFGGSGAEFDASVSNDAGLALVANAGVAEEYNEASVGVGTYFSPFPHRASDIVLNAGVEFGEFDLGITDLDDVGGYVSGYLRTRPIPQLELTGGGRFSSFFEGDTAFIASGAFQITRGLNAFGKVEIGDNDQFSLGLRLFY